MKDKSAIINDIVNQLDKMGYEKRGVSLESTKVPAVIKDIEFELGRLNKNNSLTEGSSEKTIIDNEDIARVLSYKTNDELLELYNSILKNRSYISKLNMSGVNVKLSILLDWNTCELINVIEAVTSPSEIDFTLNCKSINNGQVLLSRGLLRSVKKGNTKIDITGLNIEMQDISSINDLVLLILNSYNCALEDLPECYKSNGPRSNRIKYNLDTINKMIIQLKKLIITDINENEKNGNINTNNLYLALTIIDRALIIILGYNIKGNGKFNIGKDTEELVKSLRDLRSRFYSRSFTEMMSSNSSIEAYSKDYITSVKTLLDKAFNLLQSQIKINDKEDIVNNSDTSYKIEYAEGYEERARNLTKSIQLVTSIVKERKGLCVVRVN